MMVRVQTKKGLGHDSMFYPTVLPFELESTVEPGTLSVYGSNGGGGGNNREKLTNCHPIICGNPLG